MSFFKKIPFTTAIKKHNVPNNKCNKRHVRLYKESYKTSEITLKGTKIKGDTIFMDRKTHYFKGINCSRTDT